MTARPFSILLSISLLGVALPVARATAAQTRAFVFTTDFATGSIAEARFGPPRTTAYDLAPVCSDAIIRWHQGLLYVIERFGCDNVHVLDPAQGYATVQQFSTGNGSNPQDIVLVSPTKAYIPRYDRTELWVVNPQTGAFLHAIDLSAFADADGLPEMHRLALAGGRVFVTLQRLDRDAGFVPTDSSQVAVIDAATDTLVDCDLAAPGVQGILLPFQNPGTEIQRDAAGRLVIGCTGAFGVVDGGVARIDPVALVALGAETSEAALGGDLNDVALFDTARGFAVVSDASFNTIVVPYDRNTGARTGTVHSSTGFTLADIEVNDRGELWLCDRTPTAPGLRVFDAATGTLLTPTPLATGLPPQDLEFDAMFTVHAGVSSPGAAARLAAFPNPSRAGGEVRFAVGGASGAMPGARLEILDVAGRRVRNLIAPNPGRWLWDGRDAYGRSAPPGVYLARFGAPGVSQAAIRFVRLP
jgi:hypothetical protein